MNKFYDNQEMTEIANRFVNYIEAHKDECDELYITHVAVHDGVCVYYEDRNEHYIDFYFSRSENVTTLTFRLNGTLRSAHSITYPTGKKVMDYNIGISKDINEEDFFDAYEDFLKEMKEKIG